MLAHFYWAVMVTLVVSVFTRNKINLRAVAPYANCI